jgi:phosphocarrier protein HPr
LVERTITVGNPTGLHARPAALFVSEAARFSSKVRVRAGAREVDAKSILSVLSLGVRQGTEITIRAEGPDEEQALASLVGLIEKGFGEV